MGKKAKAPKPLNVAQQTALAQQQAGINKTAANEQTVANRPNQNTPWGSTSWQQGADGSWTQNQTLNPMDQAQLDKTRQLESQGQQIAGGLMGRAGQAMDTPLDYSSATPLTGYDMSKIDMPTNAGFEGNKEYEDAIMSRMHPDLDRRRAAEMQRLRNQGIYEGSEAFDNADTRMGRTENDAQMQAVLAGADEHAKGFRRQLDLAGQNFSQQGAQASLSGLQRQQQIAEINALRNSPMNDYQRFTQGTEVGAPQMPSFQSGTGYQGADVVGAQNTAYQNAMAKYNADAASRSGLMGGLGTLAGAGLGYMGGGMAGAKLGGSLGGSIGRGF